MVKETITMTPQEYRQRLSQEYHRGENSGFWQAVQRLQQISVGEEEPRFIEIEKHRRVLWDSVVKLVKP